MSRKTQHQTRGVLLVKAAHRVACLPESDERVRVLDCFGGEGDIWRLVNDITGGRCIVTSIDKRDDLRRGQLAVDNVRFLRSVDLDRFDVVDLDAWGQPTEQFAILGDVGYRGVVPYTSIRLNISSVAVRVALELYGVPTAWSKVAASLVRPPLRGWPTDWPAWCALHGFVDHVLSTATSPTGGIYLYGVTGDVSAWSPERHEAALVAARGALR